MIMKSIVPELTQKYAEKNQEELFNALLSIRKSMYKLLDQGVLKEDEINFFEEQILGRRGIDPEVYYDWKGN